MKRVRYVAGAAVLAPVAMGVAMPSAAQAATPRGTVPGKTVSLNHVRARVVPDSCTGDNEFHIGTNPNSHLKGHGWATRFGAGSICIGTVDFSMFYTKTFSKSAWVELKSIQGSVFREGVELHGTTGHWVASGFGIHREYTGAGVVQFSVCVGSQYGKSNCTGV